MRRNAYNDPPEANNYFQQESFPFDEFHPPGDTQNREAGEERLEDHQRDGKEFKEFDQFKRKKRISKLRKLLKEMKNDGNNPPMQPTPFYSSVYGYSGFEGAMTDPLEYYSGSISEEPGAITNNPYNTIYQSAANNTVYSREQQFKDTMALYKSSQVNEDFNFDEDEVVIYDEKPSEDDVIEMHQPDEENAIEISFKLPPLPGSDADVPLEVSTDDPIEIEEKGKDKNDLAENQELEVKDPSDYRSYKPSELSHWAQYMFSKIPRHTGKDTMGIERCISYLKKFDTDLSRAISSDYKGEADIGQLETCRRELYQGIDRLEDALEKLRTSNYKKKKADVDPELVKEAKQTRVGGIIITVPILISTIASVLINGMVSGGHDIEKMFDLQAKEYELTKREQVELMALLEAYGYAQPRRDRGYPADHQMDYRSSDNFDFSAQYPA